MEIISNALKKIFCSTDGNVERRKKENLISRREKKMENLVNNVVPSEDTSSLRQKIDGIMKTDKYKKAIDKDCYSETEIIESKKTLMIIDDVAGMIETVDELLEEIAEEYGIDAEEKYNIIRITSDMAGIIAICMIQKKNIKVDILITDILFGGIIEDNEGVMRAIDGIDVAAYMKSKNKDLRYLFYTGCEVSADKYLKYSSKYTEYFGNDITDFSVKKRPLANEAIEKIKKLISD